MDSFGGPFRPKFTVTKEVPKPAAAKGQAIPDEPHNQPNLKLVWKTFGNPVFN